MVEFLIAAGKRFHLLDESENKVTASNPGAATNFPLTLLHDRIPSRPFRYINNTPSSYDLDIDLNFAVNGNFENWTGASPDVPVGWTKGGTTLLVKETSNPISGTSSVRVDGSLLRDYEFPSGALLAFRIKMAEFGAGVNAVVSIIDQKTKEYLKPDGTWTTTLTNLFVESNVYSAAGDERTKGIVFLAQPFSLIGADITVLRLVISCGALLVNDGDEGIFDEISLVVVPNLVSVHGHNIDRKFDTQLKSSGDSAYATSPMVARQDADDFTAQDSKALGLRKSPSYYFRLKKNCPFLDGSSDAFQLAAPAAMLDSGKFTFGCWIRKDGQDAISGSILTLWDNGSSRKTLEIICDAFNAIVVTGIDGTGSTVLTHATAGEVIPPDTVWHYLLISVDLSEAVLTDRSQIYIDGVDMVPPGIATLDATIDFSAVSRISVGGDIATDVVSPDLQCSLNDLYFQPGFSEDIDTIGNREKFRIDATGERVFLGTDGSVPSGGQAYLYLHGTEANPVTDFISNFGSGGAFTIIGSPTSEVMFGTHRFWKPVFVTPTSVGADRPTKAIEAGQLFFLQAQKLLKMQRFPIRQPRFRPHVEQRSPSGHISRASMSYADVSSFAFRFKNTKLARDQWLELRDRMEGATRAVVIVPDTDSGNVHFGFLSVNFPEERRPGGDNFPVSIEFEELPFAESLGD